MHVPSTLPVRAGDLQDDEARVAGDRPRPFRGMPFGRRSRIVLGRASRGCGHAWRGGTGMTWFAKAAAVFLAVLAVVGAGGEVIFVGRMVAASSEGMQWYGRAGRDSVESDG